MPFSSHAPFEAGNPAAAFNEPALQQLRLGPPVATSTGRNVVIGFVDYGFDLLHPCLLDASGKRSRFGYLWDQNRTPDAARKPGLDVGLIEDWDAEFLNERIAQALATGSRRDLDALYDPHANNCGRHGTRGGAHGTMMVSIAAGTPFAGFRGAFAAFREACAEPALIGVQLALLDCDWKEEDTRGTPTWLHWDQERQPIWTGWRAYDEAPQIVNAVRYVYERARRLGGDALVINLSLGAWAGAKDGRSPLERGIAALLAEADAAVVLGQGPVTAVVVGAGNAGADEGHFAGIVSDGGPVTVDWLMQRADPTQNKLEVWYDSTATDRPPPEVLLAPPSSRCQPLAIKPGRTHPIFVDGVRVGIADHVPRVRGDLSRVRILLHPPLFPETHSRDIDNPIAWSLTVSAGETTPPVRLHAWVERDDGLLEQSTLLPSHPESTLCCLATAEGAIVVAGYDHHAGRFPETMNVGVGLGVMMAASSLGPAPWSGAPLPHVCAPGHRIWGARSKSQGFQQTSGTSTSVALVSGVLAAIMQRNVFKGHENVLQSLKASSMMVNRGNAPNDVNIHMNDWSARAGLGAVQFR